MVAKLYAGEKIYGDHNAHELVGTNGQVFAGGEVRYLSALPRKAAYGSLGGPTFAQRYGAAFSRDEIRTRALELERTESRLSDLIDFASKDQNGTNYCWINGVVGALECARRKQNLPHISLSPASAGGPITNYRNVGGWGEDGLKYLTQTGVCRSELWPDNEIRAGRLTGDVKRDYLNFKIMEFVDVETNNVEQLWSLLVRRIPCFLGLNWWGHLVYAVDVVVLPDGTLATRIRNSWGQWGAQNKWGVWGFGVLSESKSRGDAGGVTVATPYSQAPAEFHGATAL